MSELLNNLFRYFFSIQLCGFAKCFHHSTGVNAHRMMITGSRFQHPSLLHRNQFPCLGVRLLNATEVPLDEGIHNVVNEEVGESPMPSVVEG